MNWKEWFAARVEFSGQCWIWRGSKDRDGYGMLNRDGHTVMAHRLSHEVFTGPIPDGYQVDHLCKNESCCNPAHLEAVTPRENVYRSDAVAYWEKRRQQTHCKHGHSLADAYVGYKGRQCKTCTKLREQARRPRRRLKCTPASANA